MKSIVVKGRINIKIKKKFKVVFSFSFLQFPTDMTWYCILYSTTELQALKDETKSSGLSHKLKFLIFFFKELMVNNDFDVY